MNKLEMMIKKASQKYYEDGSSDLTDAEFDRALNQLKEENPDSPLLTDVGHGYDENLDSTPGKRCNHKYGLIKGLDKVHNWKELGNAFKENRECVASLKLDGLSIVMYYEDGQLIQALTRGGSDGKTGIDVTDKVSVILNNQAGCNFNIGLPSDSYNIFTGGFRGEIVMTEENFERYKSANQDKDVRNPRNSAAGLMNQNEISEDLKYLNIVVYSMIGLTAYAKGSYKWDVSDSYILESLEHLFSPEYVVPHQKVVLNSDTFDGDMILLNERLRSIAIHRSMSIPSDGIVLTQEKTYHNMDTFEVSYVSQAYKFPSETAECEVEDVIWKMSKTRYAIPRIKIKPVTLAGTTVTYCTGYNAKYILDNDIRKGTIVEIEKRGEIIPNINKIIKKVNDVDSFMIWTCPDCGTSLEWNGVHLCCPNPDCANANIQDVLAWINNIAPLDNFGDKLRLKFLSEYLGKEDFTVEDIMNQKDTFPYLTSQKEGVQEQLFYEMMSKLYTSKVPLVAAIKALNIPRFGDVNSEKLAQYPAAVACLCKLASDQLLCEVPRYNFWYSLSQNLGKANAESLQTSLPKFKRLNYLDGRIIQDDNKTVEMKGKVAITGKLSVKRTEFEKELKASGYQLGSISKDTNFLITDDPNSDTDKNRKADKWGIVKISEEQFRTEYLK